MLVLTNFNSKIGTSKTSWWKEVTTSRDVDELTYILQVKLVKEGVKSSFHELKSGILKVENSTH